MKNKLNGKVYCLSENGRVSMGSIVNKEVQCGAGIQISQEEYLIRTRNEDSLNNYSKKFRKENSKLLRKSS